VHFIDPPSMAHLLSWLIGIRMVSLLEQPCEFVAGRASTAPETETMARADSAIVKTMGRSMTISPGMGQ
jgi:hypothetical protein